MRKDISAHLLRLDNEKVKANNYNIHQFDGHQSLKALISKHTWSISDACVSHCLSNYLHRLLQLDFMTDNFCWPFDVTAAHQFPNYNPDKIRFDKIR